MEYFSIGGPDQAVTDADLRELLGGMLEEMGDLKRVLLVPPDFTRAHSGAGEITALLYEQLQDRAHVEVLPAIGTHYPMTDAEKSALFAGIPAEAFRVHDWRNGLTRLGEVPATFVGEVTEGKLNFPVFLDVNALLLEGKWDRIISIGQVVPHEVIGMANHNKNIYVGTGGADTINKSHFIGAVCNMEKVMGREKSPVREIFNYGDRHFAGKLPLTYVLTVRANDAAGRLTTRGVFAGEGEAVFLQAAALSQRVNLDLLEKPLEKAIVYLDPSEFKSTWLGNKAIYRTRMAMADAGELIILAPGVSSFGEDPTIDALIRKYGYRGTPGTLKSVAENADLAANLSAAAHLIHGSSEGRFRITYCAPRLGRDKVQQAGFHYGDFQEYADRFRLDALDYGWNTVPGEGKVFFVPNPALGLWGLKQQFADWKG